MGQDQSRPIADKGMFLVGKPGDTFTFTIPNAMDAWTEKNGRPAGNHFGAFMVDDKHSYRHLIFSGVLDKEVTPGIFTYKFNSVTATDTLGEKEGKPTWRRSSTLSDWWMNTYLQSRSTDSNGYLKPPTITNGPKGNLVPPVMDTQNTPGFKLDGDFGDLKPSQIYKFMNNYATQSLAVVTSSHPYYEQIQALSREYTSNAQIKSSFADTRQKMRRLIGNPRAVLVLRDATGIVRTQTTVTDFIEKPFKSITKSNPKGSKYVGVEVDANKDFESDYNNLQSSLEAYWEEVVQRHGDEAVMSGRDFEGDVVLDTPDTNIPFVHNVRDKAFKTLLGRARQLQLAGNRIDGWTQRRADDGKVHTIFYRRMYPAATSRRAHNSVSGTIRGATTMSLIEDQTKRMEGTQTTAYKSMLEKDARFSPDKIKMVRDSYIQTLAMMVAFQRLNPGQNSLIRSIGVAMGHDDGLVDGINAPLMWRYSQVMAAIIRSVDSAVADKVKRDSIRGHKQSMSVEGFMSGTAAPYKSTSHGFMKESPVAEVTTRPREHLLNAIEQNQATVEKLAGAYTESTIQFGGMIAAAGVFAAIALLPKTA